MSEVAPPAITLGWSVPPSPGAEFIPTFEARNSAEGSNSGYSGFRTVFVPRGITTPVRTVFVPYGITTPSQDRLRPGGFPLRRRGAPGYEGQVLDPGCRNGVKALHRGRRRRALVHGLDAGHWLLTPDPWMLATGHRALATGHWLLTPDPSLTSVCSCSNSLSSSADPRPPTPDPRLLPPDP